MNKYVYEDNFFRVVDGYITPKQMREDELAHGRLLFMKASNGKTINVSYTRRYERK